MTSLPKQRLMPKPLNSIWRIQSINLSHLMASWLDSTPSSLEIQNSFWLKLKDSLGMILPFLPMTSQPLEDSQRVWATDMRFWQIILRQKTWFPPKNKQLWTTTMSSTMAYIVQHCPEAAGLIHQSNCFLRA